MKTFDYIRAWKEVAKPAFDALPADVHALLATVTTLYAEEHQQKDLSMRFVNDDVRAAFDALDTQTLAHASRAVFFYGHWWPSGIGEGLGLRAGETWKFSNLADQVISERLSLPKPHLPTPRSGWSTRVQNGAIVLGYSAWDSRRRDIEFSTSREIGYAIPEVLKIAQSACGGGGDYDSVNKALDDTATLGRRVLDVATSPFALLFGCADRYMIEEDVITQRECDYAQEIARVNAKYEERVKAATDTTERDAMVWLLQRRIPVDNVIYYSHTKRFCFGWRKPVSAEAYSKLVDVLCEFQYDYDIKREEVR